MNRFISRILIIFIASLLFLGNANATVSSNTSRVKYTCSGGSSYAFTFGVSATSEIQVIKTLTSTAVETVLTETTDYTVSATNNDYSSGGTVATTVACATGYSLTIVRNVPLTQDSDFVEGQPTLYETFEDSLDKATRIAQQQNEEINRSFKVPVSSTATVEINPAANNYIGWNAAATSLENKVAPVATTATQYEIDALISYGGGTAFTQATIESALTAIGTTNEKTLLIRPGTWDISANADWSAYKNVLFKIVPGTYLQIATGTTTTIPKMDETGFHKRFTLVGTGTVRFGSNAVSRVVPQWWGMDSAATAAVNSVALQAAFDSIGTYPSIPIHIPGITVGSITPYQINAAITKTSADWIRVTGDGPGSWLEWQGANYATMVSLTGELSGNAVVRGVRFDCNNKATTGLSLAGFGHLVNVERNEFNDGLKNVADNQGMLNIPLNNETHNGRIIGNYFGGGNAIGIGLGLTGTGSGSGGFLISGNEGQQINNFFVKAKGLKESTISTNIMDNILATQTNGNGFQFDIASGLDILNNHFEGVAGHIIKLNPTTRYDFKPTTARILNNTSVQDVSGIDLGFTDGVILEGNTSISKAGTNWLTVTANAKDTVVGKNVYSSDAVGTMAWAEQYIGGAGLWNMRYSQTTIASNNAVLTLTGQSASVAWVSLTPISTLNDPDIPSNVRAYIVQASIKSATVGARLYMVNEGNAPLWVNRNTDMRVQFIEAQTASRYNTATFIIPVKNTSYEDAIYYSIDPTGVADTDVELRIVGYLMPT